MTELIYIKVREAFQKIGATKADGSDYDAVRGVSVSGQGTHFRFWTEDVKEQSPTSLVVARGTKNTPWVHGPQGQKFYVALEAAMTARSPVFVVLNKRRLNAQTCIAAAPILTADGRPAPGRVVNADKVTGAVRIEFDLTSR